MTKNTEYQRPYDFYRDSLIRVFGYGGHIGGAIRPFVPYSVVSVSRTVAATYICQHIFDKASKKSKEPERLSVAIGDATMWQMLASVIIPGIILNGVSKMRLELMCRQSYSLKRISHTGVSLLTIAIIMKPIDAIVDVIMNETYRKWIVDPPETDKKTKQLKIKN